MAKAKRAKEQARARRRAERVRLQVGALCWKPSTGGIKVLLITSRETRRWICPKGWPMSGRKPWDAAAQEAYEEAGVRGTVSQTSIGFFRYRKDLGKGRSIPCIVRVFPLKVSRRMRKFPESDQRQAKWLKPEKAAERVDEFDFAHMIRAFAVAKAQEAANEGTER